MSAHTHTHHFGAHLKLTRHCESTILQFYKGVESLRANGAGWALWPFAAVLRCLYLSSSNKIQRNHRVLQLTVCMDSGANSGQKIKKTKITSTTTSEEPGANIGCWEQKKGMCGPCTQCHHGGRRTTYKPPLWP